MHRFEVIIPTYKGSKLLPDSLASLRRSIGTKPNVIVHICDDNNVEDVEEINATYAAVQAAQIGNLRYYKNENNLGYSMTMIRLHSEASIGSVVVYFAQDDLLHVDYFNRLTSAYDANCLYTSRAFSMFVNHKENVVRTVPPISCDQAFHLTELSENDIRTLFFSLSQLSGLSHKKLAESSIECQDTFTCHMYPIVDLMRSGKGLYINDNMVLCRIESSQTIFKKTIYHPSPTTQWLSLIDTYFHQGSVINRIMRKDRARNFDGLNQIIKYSGRLDFYQEIMVMVKADYLILFDLRLYLWIFLSLMPFAAITVVGNIWKAYLLWRQRSRLAQIKESI